MQTGWGRSYSPIHIDDKVEVGLHLDLSSDVYVGVKKLKLPGCCTMLVARNSV